MINCLLRGGAEAKLVTPAGEYMATFSPDGAWLGYASNESGQDEVYVQAISESGRCRQACVDRRWNGSRVGTRRLGAVPTVARPGI